MSYSSTHRSTIVNVTYQESNVYVTTEMKNNIPPQPRGKKYGNNSKDKILSYF